MAEYNRDNNEVFYAKCGVNHAQNRLDKLIEKNGRRPFVVTYLDTRGRLHRHRRTSFKYKKLAIAKAARLRLQGNTARLREWNAENQTWTDLRRKLVI